MFVRLPDTVMGLQKVIEVLCSAQIDPWVQLVSHGTVSHPTLALGERENKGPNLRKVVKMKTAEYPDTRHDLVER
jgi:hypothetical protein